MKFGFPSANLILAIQNPYKNWWSSNDLQISFVRNDDTSRCLKFHNNLVGHSNHMPIPYPPIRFLISLCLPQTSFAKGPPRIKNFANFSLILSKGQYHNCISVIACSHFLFLWWLLSHFIAGAITGQLTNSCQHVFIIGQDISL